MTTERSLGDYHPCKLRKSSLKCKENQAKDDKENCKVTKGNWKKKTAPKVAPEQPRST